MSWAGRLVKAFAVAGLVAAVPSGTAVPGASAPRKLAGALPSRGFYAPYFTTWSRDSLVSTAVRSGARYFTLAFIQTAHPGSCTPTWDGNPRQTVATHFLGKEIAGLRSMGGGAIISFGGSAADNSGTEIADSCHSVSRIAAAYESVITTYGVTRLDMDIEGRSLADPGGINRRDQALRLTEQWAARHRLPLKIQYTMPALPSGLPANCLTVLQNAIAHGVRIDTVNVMAFDYYRPHEGVLNMGASAVSALRALHTELTRIYRPVSSAKAWGVEGITLLPGIDSYPGRTEITYLADAAQVLRLAERNRLGLISIWSIQRDNGSCPGVADSGRCSGIAQTLWQFSRLLVRFSDRS